MRCESSLQFGARSCNEEIHWVRLASPHGWRQAAKSSSTPINVSTPHRVSHQLFCQSIESPVTRLCCHKRNSDKTRQPLAGKCITAKKSAYRKNFHHTPPPAPALSVK